jgi:D-3-phosphoglycerate dehydrogenase
MLDTEKLKVLIPQQILSEGINYLTTLGYEVTHGSGFDELAIIDSIKDCSAILIRNAQITKKVIDAAPKLRVIARHGVGVDNIDVAYATERGIWVTNAPESNYNAVAEHTIMVLLALAKNLLINSEAFAKGDFNVRHRIINNEVKGKVLGVVGYGRVGKEVSKKAFYGLDMEVLVFDPFVKKEELPNFVNHSETLEHLFATSDYITLHLPSNPLTKEIINYNYLKLISKDLA